MTEFDQFTHLLASERRNTPVFLNSMSDDCTKLAEQKHEDEVNLVFSPDCPRRLSLSVAIPNDTQDCCNCFSPTEHIVCDACVAGKSSCGFPPRVNSLKDILRVEEVEESCWASYGTTTSFCCCKQDANVSHHGLVGNFASVVIPASATPGLSFIDSTFEPKKK